MYLKGIFFSKYKLIMIIFLLLIILKIKYNKKLKIGIIGVRHEVNIGNNLIKFAISIKLSELGFIPYIIGTHWNNFTLSFINKTVNLVIIKNNFSEIKKDQYDILMVNSDQTWRKFDENYYDYGFLKFAKNWTIPKFIYGASLGFDYWPFNAEEEKNIKVLIKQFKNISVREQGSINLIKKHLKIEPEFVLDPTLLIDKKYYINIIRNYSSNIYINDNYIFAYIITVEKNMDNFINRASKKLNYKVYNMTLDNQSTVEEFIYRTINCQAIVTNSYHGTIFSIIFNKPFVTFNFKDSARERLISLGNLFGFKNRIFEYNQNPNVNLLTLTLDVNLTLINYLRLKSIEYIKKNIKL